MLEEMGGNRKAAIYYRKMAREVKVPYSADDLKEDQKTIKDKSKSKDEVKEAKKSLKSKKKANKDFQKYKELIDNGYDIRIDTIKDENLHTALQDYMGYLDSSRDAEKTIQDLHNQLIDLFATWAKAPLEEAEKQISKIEHQISMVEKQLQKVESTLAGIRKGGSTLAALEGGANPATLAGGGYKLLGGAAYRAFRANNKRKIGLMQQKNALIGSKAGVWSSAAGQILSNMGEYQRFAQKLIDDKIKERDEAQAKYDARVKEIAEKNAEKNNRITKKQVKAAGKKLLKNKRLNKQFT
jgi:hypothetical protein